MLQLGTGRQREPHKRLMLGQGGIPVYVPVCIAYKLAVYSVKSRIYQKCMQRVFLHSL